MPHGEAAPNFHDFGGLPATSPRSCENLQESPARHPPGLLRNWQSFEDEVHPPPPPLPPLPVDPGLSDRLSCPPPCVSPRAFRPLRDVTRVKSSLALEGEDPSSGGEDPKPREDLGGDGIAAWSSPGSFAATYLPSADSSNISGTDLRNLV